MWKQNALCYQYDNSKDCHFNNVSVNSILRQAVNLQTILLLNNGQRVKRSWEKLDYIKSLFIFPLLDKNVF